MPKPKPKPQELSEGATKSQVRLHLKKLVAEWVAWHAHGMPKREPLSEAELERRIRLVHDALRWL